MTAKQPFEQVVVEHGLAVLRLCRSMLCEHDADDAWSETFLAALRTYPALPGGANVQAWLVTIARRKCIDVLRAVQRRPVPLADPPDGRSDLGIWTAPDDDLFAALAALPGRQRRAVGYHYLAGLSYAEVADLVGGSTDAARRAAADGISRLRRRYPLSIEGDRP